MINTIDTETIMVNLLNEDKKRYCTMDKVQKLCGYIYESLVKNEIVKDYFIRFDVDFESIERTVLYNNRIFRLDIEGEIVYLREKSNVESLVEQFPTDERIRDIIHEFNKMYAA